LPQQEQLLPQLIFHLHAMQMHCDCYGLQHILPEQNSVVLLHIQQLDTEDIGGAI